MNNFEFGETMKNRTKAFESSSLRSALPTVDPLIAEETVKWDTFGFGTSSFEVRGQAKRDPALARWAGASSTVKAPSRCALQRISKRGRVPPILRTTH